MYQKIVFCLDSIEQYQQGSTKKTNTEFLYYSYDIQATIMSEHK